MNFSFRMNLDAQEIGEKFDNRDGVLYKGGGLIKEWY